MRKGKAWAGWVLSVLFLAAICVWCVSVWNPLALGADGWLAKVFTGTYERMEVQQLFCTRYAQPAEHLCRAQLSQPAWLELYDRLEEAAYEISAKKQSDGTYALREIWISGTQLSAGQIQLVFTAFQNDHPEVFWLSNAFGYAYRGFDTRICFYSRVSAAECPKLSAQLRDSLQELLDEVGLGLTEYAREVLAYRLVTQTVQYDGSAAQDMTEWRAYTALGALVDHTAVCEGYARALQLLLQQLGLSSRTVCGGVQSGPHMWNLIRVDGRWYHADATWDDSTDALLFRYFNLTDAQMLRDHTVASQAGPTAGEGLFNLPLPACTDATRTYYRECGLSIGALTEQEDGLVTAEVVRAVGEREQAVFFYVPEAYDFFETVDSFFRAEPYKFQYCLRQADALLPQGLGNTVCHLALETELRGAAVLFYEE